VDFRFDSVLRQMRRNALNSNSPESQALTLFRPQQSSSQGSGQGSGEGSGESSSEILFNSSMRVIVSASHPSIQSEVSIDVSDSDNENQVHEVQRSEQREASRFWTVVGDEAYMGMNNGGGAFQLAEVDQEPLLVENGSPNIQQQSGESTSSVPMKL